MKHLRQSKSKSILCIMLALIFVMCFVFSAAAASPSVPAKAGKIAVLKTGDNCKVSASALNMRSGAGTNNKRLMVLKKGTQLTVVGKKGNWYQIRTASGKVGFVYGKYITPAKTAAPVAVVVPSKPTPSKTSTRPVQLTISAAASLTDAVTEIAELYKKENKNASLTLNFGSSGSLQQQIEQGAPVDVFCSAAPKQMNALQEKGLLVAGTRQDLLWNRMVLITPKASTLITDCQDLTNNKVKVVAIGEPESVPAGKYAQEILTKLNLWDKVNPKLVLAKNVRQVLAYVETGDADAGFVFLTDAKISDKVKVVEQVDNKLHSPIIYPVAVIKDTKDLAAAKDFTAFMASDKAKPVFEKFGFTVVSK